MENIRKHFRNCLLFKRITQERNFNVLYFFNTYIVESLKKSLTVFSMAPLVLLPDTYLLFPFLTD
jgi:hypothetical protein